MKKLNNNELKAQLVNYVADNYNLTAVKELDLNLTSGDVQVSILTNIYIQHDLIFDCHCNLKSMSHKSLSASDKTLTTLTKSCFDALNDIVDFSTTINK